MWRPALVAYSKRWGAYSLPRQALPTSHGSAHGKVLPCSELSSDLVQLMGGSRALSSGSCRPNKAAPSALGRSLRDWKTEGRADCSCSSLSSCPHRAAFPVLSHPGHPRCSFSHDTEGLPLASVLERLSRLATSTPVWTRQHCQWGYPEYWLNAFLVPADQSLPFASTTS